MLLRQLKKIGALFCRNWLAVVNHRWDAIMPCTKYWEIIADNLSRAGWSWGCVSAFAKNFEPQTTKVNAVLLFSAADGPNLCDSLGMKATFNGRTIKWLGAILGVSLLAALATFG